MLLRVLLGFFPGASRCGASVLETFALHYPEEFVLRGSDFHPMKIEQGGISGRANLRERDFRFLRGCHFSYGEVSGDGQRLLCAVLGARYQAKRRKRRVCAHRGGFEGRGQTRAVCVQSGTRSVDCRHSFPSRSSDGGACAEGPGSGKRCVFRVLRGLFPHPDTNGPPERRLFSSLYPRPRV